MEELLAIGFIVLIGLALLLIFFLSNRKIKEEKDKTPLHEEKCNIVYVNSIIPLRAGGNIRAGRIAFYEKFIVVSFLGTTLIPYSEIESFKQMGSYIDIRRYDSKIKIQIFSNFMEKVLKIFGEHVLDKRK